MLFAKVVWAAGEIKPSGSPDGNFEKYGNKIYINLINFDAGLQWFRFRFVPHNSRFQSASPNCLVLVFHCSWRELCILGD